MKLPISSRHQVTFAFDKPAPHFLIIALDVARKLEWNISEFSEHEIECYTPYSLQTSGEQIIISIENNEAIISSQCVSSQLYDWGKNAKNIQNFIDTYTVLKDNYSAEELDERYEALKPHFATIEAANKGNRKKIRNIFSLFIPVEGYFITPLLIDINILTYIIMVACGVNFFSPSIESLLLWGGNLRMLTLDGQWWRLFTCLFIHGGILHLLFNMYALLYIGMLLEPMLGKIRFLGAYLLSGITSSLLSLIIHDNIVSVGASGAIFGLYGVFFAMLTTSMIEKNARNAMLQSIGFFIIYNLVFGMKAGVDNAAHIGGLIGGVIIGYTYYITIRAFGSEKSGYQTVITLSLLTTGLSFLVIENTSNDLKIYQNKLQQFANMESMALEVFKLPSNTPKDQVMHEINDRGIYYWNENIDLLRSFSNLNLPEKIQKRNKILIHYCELRIDEYQLIYKSLDEGTHAYNDQITKDAEQINEILDNMKNKNK